LSLNGIDHFAKTIMNHGDYVPFLYLVAEKMKSHEFDESYFNILIDNVNDFNPDKY
jgi:hypothetical protein